jgi:hypothetical protein
MIQTVVFLFLEINRLQFCRPKIARADQGRRNFWTSWTQSYHVCEASNQLNRNNISIILSFLVTITRSTCKRMISIQQ